MYHTIIVVGNVGREPEMRFTPSGKPVTNFSVAVNREYTLGDGEKVKETLWFNITTWGKQAEVCKQYVNKGMKVLIEGRLTPDKATGGPRIWQKNDGTSAANFEITAGTVRFLGGGKHSDDSSGAVGEMPDDDIDNSPPEDDIPF